MPTFLLLIHPGSPAPLCGAAGDPRKISRWRRTSDPATRRVTAPLPVRPRNGSSPCHVAFKRRQATPQSSPVRLPALGSLSFFAGYGAPHLPGARTPHGGSFWGQRRRGFQTHQANAFCRVRRNARHGRRAGAGHPAASPARSLRPQPDGRDGRSGPARRERSASLPPGACHLRAFGLWKLVHRSTLRQRPGVPGNALRRIFRCLPVMGPGRRQAGLQGLGRCGRSQPFWRIGKWLTSA